ncbi:hypothetical protein PPTG_20718 [Phytophthora nicotianae INRA-310]|uniref:Uncharacterized protein n=1 Tax=Phytophthora nicotianae (strain INRA-310) TaxID=761204 RepID=W2RGT5_PHYN3|nr:hypothetical protein PPTG_20718 [Phytophthora nicotianae INRA-310]ETN23839.1 hypothetical protein PPTG_20718 [Phytophthora nicotianae INRA-310]
MESDSDDDIFEERRVAREMLDASRFKRLHGGLVTASRLRHYDIALLCDSGPQFSIHPCPVYSTAAVVKRQLALVNKKLIDGKRIT